MRGPAPRLRAGANEKYGFWSIKMPQVAARPRRVTDSAEAVAEIG